MKLPHPVVENVEGIMVVRDDLLPGGTKSRVMDALLSRPVESSGFDLFSEKKTKEFVYASPACGYAQLALALACQRLGYKATIFTGQRKERHRLTTATMDSGATVVELRNARQSNLQAKAREHTGKTGAVLLPFGLDCPVVLDGLADVARKIKATPKEVWCVAGSGTLARALQRAWPDAAFHVVRIGTRKSNIGSRAKEYIAPEDFSDDAKYPPPFSSCLNYDAKAWAFIKKFASPGAWFWNVAGV